MKVNNRIGISALKIVGIILGLCVLAFVLWILSLPEGGGGVKMANEMDAYALEYIDKHNLLNETEKLIAYYDVTISLNGSEAAILTTERVIYHKNKKNFSVSLEDIVDIEHRYEKFVGDIIDIKSKSGIPFKIEIAPFNQGEYFVKALMDAWERSKSEVP